MESDGGAFEREVLWLMVQKESNEDFGEGFTAALSVSIALSTGFVASMELEGWESGSAVELEVSGLEGSGWRKRSRGVVLDRLFSFTLALLVLRIAASGEDVLSCSLVLPLSLVRLLLELEVPAGSADRSSFPEALRIDCSSLVGSGTGALGTASCTS